MCVWSGACVVHHGVRCGAPGLHVVCSKHAASRAHACVCRACKQGRHSSIASPAATDSHQWLVAVSVMFHRIYDNYGYCMQNASVSGIPADDCVLQT